MNIQTLLSKLRAQNIRVHLTDGELRVSAPEGVLTPALVQELKEHKPAITEFLLKLQSGNYTVIPTVAKQAFYQLSPAQNRLWILQQYEKNSPAYNIPVCFHIKGNLDKEFLDRALSMLVARHEMLRTVFKEVDGAPMQFILAPDEISISSVWPDVRNEADPKAAALQLANAAALQPFELSQAPLARVEVIQFADAEFIFLLSMHHIIADEWSLKIIMQELLSLYEACRLQAPDPLEPLRIQYKDVAAWQLQELQQGKSAASREYWLEKLSGELPVLQLPADRQRPPVQTFNGSQVVSNISTEILNEFRELCRLNNATLLMGLMSLVKTLLFHYTNQTDVIVGLPVAGRDHPDLDNQVGFYVNTLAIRTQANPSAGFSPLLEQVKQSILEAYEHQSYPFDFLVRELAASRDVSRSPLFDVMVVLENPQHQNNMPLVQGLAITEVVQPMPVSKFDLTFYFTETVDGLQLALEYNTDLYNAARIQRMSMHLQSLMTAVIKQPAAAIQAVHFLDAGEVHKLLHDYNQTAASYPAHQTITGLFDTQARLHANDIAIATAKNNLSYAELNTRANQLAHYLRSVHNVQPGELIGVHMERTEWLLIAILGILKSGAAYLPIDMSYPAERVRYLLKDGNVRVVLQSAQALELDCTVVSIESLQGELQLYSSQNPEQVNDAEQLAYVIYTSGSTGQPKGVMIRHRSVVNMVMAVAKEVSMQSSDKLVAVTTHAFDMSVVEFLLPLLHGAQLYLATDKEVREPSALAAAIELYGATIMQATPGLWNMLFESGWGGHKNLRIISGGESIAPALASKLLQGCQKVWNMYGPTEITVYATAIELKQVADVVLIGRPIQNTQAYILNAQLQPVPEGIAGTLYIGGAGLAKGYLNLPALTAERFVQSPFTAGETLYDTGDLCYWTAEGFIRYVGRKDDQVKIRGYRIEPAEIEKLLMQFPGTRQGVVICRERNQEKYLVAYLVADQKLDINECRRFLRSRLPEYMVPGWFVLLDALPLTSNGKINKHLLPQPGEQDAKVFTAPRNAVEEKLVNIWMQVLDRERVSINDNFFEIGGHSLKAVQLISRIHQQLSVKLNLFDLFTHPILHELAQLVARANAAAYKPIPATAVQDTYPLSHAQRRLWLQEKQQEGLQTYTISITYRLLGALDSGALQNAFNQLSLRHESLRTVFELVQGEPRQRILPGGNFMMAFEDLRNGIDAQAQAEKEMQRFAADPFDLEKAPLLRVKLLRCADEEHLLLLSGHHIILDEWSMQVLVKEVVALYNAHRAGLPDPLLPLPIQYKDYAAWQQKEMDAEADRAYWLNRFAGDLPVLSLPTDFPRPEVQTYRGEHVFFKVSPGLFERLQELCRQEGASLFMGLVAVVRALLYRYSGQQDIILGSPVAGRDHPDLEGQIGYFLNTLVLRNEVDGMKGFSDLLRREKQVVLEAFDHREYPFDRIVEELDISRRLDRSVLFDVAIILQNVQLNRADQLQMNDVEVEVLETALAIAKSDLRFQFIEEDGALGGDIEYNTDIFKRERIDKMITHLLLLLETVTRDPQQALQEVEYRTEAEKADAGFAVPLPVQEQTPVHELFAKVCLAHGGHIAIEESTGQVSYAALLARVHQLTGLLQAIGLRQGESVVTMLSSGAGLVSSMLGVFMNGGVYVPADTNFSQRRLQQLFAETRPRVLITGSEQKEAVLQLVKELKLELPFIVVLPASGKGLLSELQIDLGEVVEMEAGLPEVMQFANGNYNVIPVDETNLTPATIDPDAACYIFYTSGSTGTGKGIAGTHRSLSHYVQWHINEFGVSVNDRISQLAPVTFDASLKDILVALCAGATLCVPSPSIKNNMPLLAEWMQQQQVSILQTVPSVFRLLTRCLKSPLPKLRQVVLAGERLYGRDVMKFKEVNGNHARISNLYGLTETTILKTCYHLPQQDWQPGETIPVGVAIAGTLIAVMQENQPCLGGEIGEVFIKSPYFTLGYLDQSLNENMFIQNPLVNGRKDIVCRTGDIGRLRTDGTLEVLGRKDEQVKLHGVRVELNEVKKALLELEGIDQVELLVHNDDDYGQELVAYYTGRKRTAEALRAELKPVLNEQLLPGYFVWLQEFPLNINGKVDRKQLPRPDELLERGQYEEPQGATEQSLALIWQQVLGVKRVGRKDSFFNLGGSSLKAIQLISRIYKEQDVQITIAEVFNAPVLSDMAALVDQAQKAAYEPIERAPEQDTYPLTHAQHRLWLVDQRQQDTLPFNWLDVYNLKGNLNKQALEAAFISLVERHESLRTVFEMVEGQPRQRILNTKQSNFSITYIDLPGHSDPQSLINQQYRTELSTPFHLQRGPLLRVKLVSAAANDHYLMIATHHLISDEWSRQVMVKELVKLYNAYCNGKSSPLASLPIQYKDYVGWLSCTDVAVHRDYWQQQFAGELPVLELPADNPRPAVQTYRGDHLIFELSQGSAERLEDLCRQQGATLFMGLVALVRTLLYRYSNQHDIILGSPVAGRDHPDLEGQIGYYLNTVALRGHINDQAGFNELLAQEKQTVLNAFEHQQYPFDKLVEELGLSSNASRAPLFDVAIVLQNIQLNREADLQMLDMEVELLSPEIFVSKGDLRFQFTVEQGTLKGDIEFNTDIFKKQRIERMVQHIENLLDAVTRDPQQALQEVEYRTEAEKADAGFAAPLPVQEQTPVHELFAKVCLAHGGNIAIEESTGQVSYASLQARVHQLAGLLQAIGLRQGESVVTMLSSGAGLVSSMLGVFMNGGVYVPADTNFSQRRLQQLFAETRPRVLITGSEQKEAVLQLVNELKLELPFIVVLPASGKGLLSELQIDLGEVVEMEAGLPEVMQFANGDYQVKSTGEINFTDETNFTAAAIDPYGTIDPTAPIHAAATIDPDAACYIFYTSGSTGTGKGIAGTHRSLSHYVQWHINEFGVSVNDRISQLAPVTFDASLKDILVALCAGATLCVPSPSIKNNMPLLAEWMQQQQVSILQTVPSVFRLLTRNLKNAALRQVVLAGEKLYGRDVMKFKEVNGNHARISNLYGLTETTILKTCYHITENNWQPGEAIPVGYAISSTVIAVLQHNSPCLGGEIGDIYIKSPYFSKGYLQEELNKDMFIQNPLVTDRMDIVCRTGDIGRLRTDGTLEVLGRKDEQVKLHGVRVELNEVKKALLELEGIDQVELLVHNDDDYGQELVAYYTGRKRTAEALRAELKPVLNEQLLPGYFVWLQEFPLNINGKVDRKQLPRPDELLERGQYEEPKGATEQTLALIWQQVLGVKRVGRKDSFFNLGGSSLKAIQLISRIYKEQDVQITIAEVFNAPVLSDMAALVDQAQKAAYEPIERAPEQDTYPLTHAQHRLWLVDQRQQDTLPFNGIDIYRLKGQLDKSALQAAFSKLIARHESLRTIFVLESGRPRQRILEEQTLQIQFYDLQGQDADSFIKNHVDQELTTPFNLLQGPMLRVRLLQLQPNEHCLLIASHHINTDEWSRQVIVRDVLALYNAFQSGAPDPLAALPIQYKDYAVWQQQQLSAEKLTAHRNYWLQQFAGELPLLELPMDHPRPAVQTFKGEHVFFKWSPDASRQLQQLCQQQGATLFMALAALVRTLLYRYSNQQDIILGSPVAGRDHPDLEEQVGYYLNTIALRGSINGQSGFNNLLEQEKQTVLNAFDHQQYPFDLLVNDLGLTNDVSRAPLFDVTVILQNIQFNQDKQLQMHDVDVEVVDADIRISKGDLRFQFIEENDTIRGDIEYNTDLYSRERIDQLIIHLQQLLAAVLQDPAKPLQELDYRGEDPRNEFDFAAVIPIRHQTPVNKIFSECARQFAKKIAIEEEGERIAYGKLNELSNRLSHLLTEIGLDRGKVALVMLPSGIRLVSSMMATWKSGGIYLPADVSLSRKRILQLLQENQPQIFITGAEHRQEALQLLNEPGIAVPYLVVLHASATSLLAELDIDDAGLIKIESEAVAETFSRDETGYYDLLPLQLKDYTANEPAVITDADAGCYIFYTSGSTGAGKGIVGTHRSLSHYTQWHINEFAITANDRISQLAPVTFDASLKDILPALCTGATLCIPAPATKRNMPLLAAWMQSSAITIIQTVPSLFRLLTASLQTPLVLARQIVLAGERLFGGDVLKWKAINGDQARISNLYGLTETTILKTCYHIEHGNWQPGEAIPAGYPINSTMIAVVQHNSPCLGGEIGDIYIKSPYFTKGYLQEELNKEMFVQNPLVTNRTDIVCRTGDFGRIRPDGSLEVLGRRDEQVKINGVRIELNEVRKAVLELEGIEHAELVIHQNEEQSQSIVCYYTGTKRNAMAMRAGLSASLNEQLMPAYFVWMQEFPLNINGKVDKKLLPKPEELLERASYEAPQNATEQQLATIWEQVLGVKRVGRNDSFFNLGGASMKAMQLISKLYRECNVQLTIAEVFSNPMFAAMAQLIAQAQRKMYEPIEQAPQQETYPLTHAQHRLWLIDQRQQDSLPFNGIDGYSMKGALDREALNNAFINLVHRHESLRTVFEMKDGELRQRILPFNEAPIDFKFIDAAADPLPAEFVRQQAALELSTAFQLDKGPMLRIRLIRTGVNEHVLLLSSHHIISDEWSRQVLVKEMVAMYNANVKGIAHGLEPLTVQYKDYTVWQLQQLTADKLEAHRAYWLNKFAGELPVLELQPDHPRPALQTFRGEHVFFSFAGEASQRFRELCQQEDATLFMGLLALVRILLYRYSGQHDIILGSPVAGRDHPDLEEQIGYYLNTVALRTQVEGRKNFAALLQQEKQTVLEAFSHQSYPFDKLVEDLGIANDASRAPLFDVTVILQNIQIEQEAALQMEGIEIEPLNPEWNISKGDLRFQFTETNGNIGGDIEYNTDLYDRARIDKMITHLQGLLQAIIDDPSQSLRKLQYIPEAESQVMRKQTHFTSNLSEDY